MHRLDRICAVFLFSLWLGCSSRSEPAAGPDRDGGGERTSDNSAPAQPTAPAKIPAATILPPEIPSTARFPTRHGGNPVAYKYQVKLHSRCTAQTPNGPANRVNADTSFTYVWRWRGSVAELLLDSLEVRTTVSGQPMMESTMSGSHFYLKQGDQTMDETFETANPELRQVLHDCFRTPMCRVAVDPQGRELKRTITAGPAAQAVVNTGIISNARLFHAPFPPGRASWQASCEMAMGNGEYARGDLNYETTERTVTAGDEPSNLVEVKVCGTLSGDASGQTGYIQDATYQLEGVQLYNTRLCEWVAGSLSVQVSFDTFATQQKISNRGTVQLGMQLVSSERLPPVRVAERAEPRPQ